MLVAEARSVKRSTTPAITGETKEPAETGGLFLNILSTDPIALVEGSSKSIMVGLFPSHANELRKAHRHLLTEAIRERLLVTGGRKRKTQPRLSSERVSQISTAYEAGKTIYELAAEYGCHRVTISAALQRQGVNLRRTSPSPEQINEMVRLYGSGHSLAKVGDRLGFNATTVLSRLKERGVATRDSHGNDQTR